MQVLYVDNKSYPLKEGDYITVAAKTTNTRFSQMFRSVLYGTSGNDAIVAQASGLVVTTGY